MKRAEFRGANLMLQGSAHQRERSRPAIRRSRGRKAESPTKKGRTAYLPLLEKRFKRGRSKKK